MVTTAVKPIVINDNDAIIQAPQKSPSSTTNGHRKMCPRCNTVLRINYTEPECLQCGYADYTYTPTSHIETSKSIIGTATRDVLRYVGDFPKLSNTLTHVKLIRVRNRVVYGVKCPFCNKSMDQSSLSGKRRQIREERYKCDDGHRVSLIPGNNGSLVGK